TGSNGISLSGGDRKTLTGPGHIAEDNHIHHMGVFNKNACGISMYGVDNTAAHNHIHDGPRMGVQMSGNNLVVEYNHLHHLCLETQDGGAIYTGGRDWISSRGSKWRYNLIHDIVGCGQESGGLKHPWFTFGLYPDDNSGGIDIIGNIVFRVAHTPIHMHNSRDCIVENNIFALGGKFQFDLHGWTKEQRFYTSHLETMVKGYESVAGQPAWKDMRNMDLHPKDAIRDDGTMMSGNVVCRNIMFSDQPGIKYGDLRHVSPKWNVIDQNLAWANGHAITTGINKVGPDKPGEPLLTETFDTAEPGKAPKGWGFNHRPNKDVQLVVADGALRADCALGEDPKNPKTVFHGPDIPIKPGAAYRMRLRVKSTEPTAKLSLAFASFKNGEGYWQAGSTSITATPEWTEFEATGRMPRENEAAWKPWMKHFWLRIDCHEPRGQIFIDDIRLTECEPLDEWTSWQAEGWDKHSLIADPLFVDWKNDDFRLQPESPAFKLGFKAIPVEKIGVRIK
ncbi:MAG TPA: right-handed parallel beta-helix repeat-containing protein, partial [Prosthecobacter sp.]|nr:right-handed parallel beta-helix repeat-containing protein [Prosthecobacter sp.]